MKHTHLSKIMGAGLLSLSLAIAPLSLPATAQTDTTTTTSPNTTTQENKGPVLDTTPFQETKGDRSNNWGWLGLIGLLGLLNLFRKRKATVYRDPADPGSDTSTRY